MAKFLIGIIIGVSSTIAYFNYFDVKDINPKEIVSNISDIRLDSGDIKKAKESINDKIESTTDWMKPIYSDFFDSAGDTFEDYCEKKGFNEKECSKEMAASFKEWIKTKQ